MSMSVAPGSANGDHNAGYEAALAAFLAANPAFDHAAVENLRAREYGRLDEQEQVYLDYTGGGLHADSQVLAHMEMLRGQVLGNPHSHNPTSLAMTELVEQARAYVLEFFNADPAEYVAIFTPNASGALKLVGESYPFAPGGRFALAFDNHNSVNGIREFARAKGSEINYVPVLLPELRLDQAALDRVLGSDQGEGAGHKLFAFPAQSNFSGAQHPLTLVAEAQARGWDVLLDAAAFAPTNRLDLGVVQPDFVSLSFYKIFGYPTGLGCLLARRPALTKLRRPWFAGGTISIASVQGDGHYFAADEAAFEDGTIDYLNIPAVETGLRHVDRVGIDHIHDRVMALTGWLLTALADLQHGNGRPVVHVYGPAHTEMRGGTVTLTFTDPEGVALDEQRVEELANFEKISLRTGCFCNPGAGEVAHGLTAAEMQAVFAQGEHVSFEELRAMVRTSYQKSVASIRVSVGIATTFADVYRFVEFARGFIDRAEAEIGPVQRAANYAVRDVV